MDQCTIQKNASLIAQSWIEHEPTKIQSGLQNENGFGTNLGLQVHGILQVRSPQIAQSYYQKVLKFGI